MATESPCRDARKVSMKQTLSEPGRIPASCSARWRTAFSILGLQSFILQPQGPTIGANRRAILCILWLRIVPGEPHAVSTLQRLTDRGLVKPPRWLPGQVMYETIMGSVAYGVSSDTSDVDVYGWAIPPKEDIFPHLRGEIPGFGKQAKRFEQYQEHHVEDRDALAGHGRMYDLTIFGIVKFFALAMENNPNIIDSLFTPTTCVLHSTKVGNLVRENRRLFLHKGAWPKFKGYAYSQLHKIAIKQPQGKRAELVAEHGFDTKFGYHVVRLIGEVEQILLEGDIDLQRNNEQLKTIRRGEWTEDRLRGWFADKESHLERLYAESTLRAVPDEGQIKALLMQCLEEHYGSLEGCVVDPDRAVAALRNILAELERVRDLL
jgi:uncharacterized protein